MIKKILLSAILVVSAVQFSNAGDGDEAVNSNDKTASHAVRIEILPLSSLEFVPTNDASSNFVFEDLGDLTTGKTRQGGTLKISSNKKWNISALISGDEEIIGNKSIFTISENNTVFGQFDAENKMNLTSGNEGSELTKDVFYKVTPGVELAPDVYNVEILYTLSQD